MVSSIRDLIDKLSFWIFTKRYRGWTEQEFWEEYAQIYKNLQKGFVFSRLMGTIEDLIDFKQKDREYLCLDVGCGPLNVTKVLLKKAQQQKIEKIKVIAIDIVLKTAREALEKIELKDKNKIELIKTDISKPLGFGNEKFDSVGANISLPYIVEFNGSRGKSALKKVLEEMYRILKPGGQLIWSSPKKNAFFQIVFLVSIPSMLNFYEYIVHKDFTRILQAIKILSHGMEIQRKGREGIYTFLPVKEAIALMEEIGFNNIKTRRSVCQQIDVYSATK